MPVSRLFVEIGQGVDRMNASLRQAMTTAEQTGVKVTGAGKSILSSFDAALNPTKALGEQMALLERSGKSSAEIWAVYGERLKSAAAAAEKNKQAIDPLVVKHLDLNKSVAASKFNFESLGTAIQNFAANPLQAAQSGLTSLLGTLGPTAVGIGAVAAGAVAAGVAIFKVASEAADAAEKIQNLSYTTGMTVQNVQALQRLGKERGLGDLTGMIEKLNVQLGSKTGGDFTEAILRSGIAPKAGADAIYYLEEMRKRYAAISDEATRAQKVAGDFGRRLFSEAGPLVLNSLESISKQLEAIKTSGALYADVEMKRLLELGAMLDEHGRSWELLTKKMKLAALETFNFLTKTHSQELMEFEGPLIRDRALKARISAPGVPSGATNTAEITSRDRIIAEAQARRNGLTGQALSLQMRLNALEKEYSAIEQARLSVDGSWNSQRLMALANEIGAIKKKIELQKTHVAESAKIAKEIDEPARRAMSELEALRKSLEKSMDKNGLISADLRKQIEGLGHDLGAFDSLANLNGLNKSFDDLYRHFKSTTEILPELRSLFTSYGGDIARVTALTEQLSGLKASEKFISSLQAQIKNLVPEIDPTKAMLSGKFDGAAMRAFMGAGLDPGKFASLSRISGMEQNWDAAVKSGKIGPDLRDALKTFGGERGQRAVSRLDSGLNTITPDLLEKTKSAMDAAYRSAIRDALSYTEGAQKGVASQIADAQQNIASEFDRVGLNISRSIDTARDELIKAINNLVNAFNPNFIGPIPQSSGITINGPIYGFDDFTEKVRLAGINLTRRGESSWL